MTKTFEAVFDGEVLRPVEPVSLEPNTKVRLTLEVETAEAKPKSFLQTAKALELDGPADWSENLDDYLYAKQNTGNS